MSEQQAKPTMLDFTEVMTVLVGKEEKAYILHKCYVTKSSEFLTAAVNGNWQESTNCKVRFPEVDTSLFDHYVQWLYTGETTIQLPDDVASKDTAIKKKLVHPHYVKLMKLYVLSYFLLDVAFRNQVIDMTLKMYDDTGILPSLDASAQMWNNTPDDCAMKHLIMRWWVLGIASTAFTITEQLPTFQLYLLEEFVKLRDSICTLKQAGLKERCDYHEHDDKVPRCSQRHRRLDRS